MKKFESLMILVIIVGLIAIIGMATNVDKPRTWVDTEYETNRQCAYLKGEELKECRDYFNL